MHTIYQWSNVPQLPNEALRLHLLAFGIRILRFSCRSLWTAKDHHCLGNHMSQSIVAACIWYIFHHSCITGNYQQYTCKKSALFAIRRDTSALERMRGEALTKKKMRIPGSLSLSLSLSLLHWKRESERRGRGELDPIGSNHPNLKDSHCPGNCTSLSVVAACIWYIFHHSCIARSPAFLVLRPRTSHAGLMPPSQEPKVVRCPLSVNWPPTPPTGNSPWQYDRCSQHSPGKIWDIPKTDAARSAHLLHLKFRIKYM